MNKQQTENILKLLETAHNYLDPKEGMISHIRLGLVHLVADHVSSGDSCGNIWDLRRSDIGFSFKILMELIESFETYFSENDWEEIKAVLEKGGKDE